MDAGEMSSLTPAGRRRIGAAVRRAERRTGLQLAVAIGDSDVGARTTAESLFSERGLAGRPAVLLLVAPAHREVELITSVEARRMVPDAVCAHVVTAMLPHFVDGDLSLGLVAGVEDLARQAAGPPARSRSLGLFGRRRVQRQPAVGKGSG